RPRPRRRRRPRGASPRAGSSGWAAGRPAPRNGSSPSGSAGSRPAPSGRCRRSRRRSSGARARAPRLASSVPLLVAAHGLAGPPVGLAVGDRRALVVQLLAAREAELDLGPAVLPVELGRHEGETALAQPPAQPVDLAPVEQELAHPLGRVVLATRVRVGG